MLNHLQHKHKDWYVQKLARNDCDRQFKIQVDSTGNVDLGTTSATREKTHCIPSSCVLTCYIQRPVLLVCDPAFHQFCHEISLGSFDLCSVQEVNKQVRNQSA